MTVRTFADVTAVTPRGPGRYDIDVSPDWTVVSKPNGGYLLAMLTRAAVGEVTQSQVLAASAHYLHSPDPGPAWIEIAVLRAGRSVSQVRARMHQGEEVCVEALVTVGNPRPGGYEWTRTPVPHVAAWSDCVRLPSTGPGGMVVAIMDQVDLRLDPVTLGFATGRPSGRGVLAGWLALPGGADFDDISLVMALDCFPPATFEIGPSGWVPTMEFTTYIRATPAPGPVRVVVRAGAIEGDLVDETCQIWDSTDHLVAQSTQLAGIRMPAPASNVAADRDGRTRARARTVTDAP